MKVIAVIPARLASTRFPKKILAKIGDKTMLERVYLAALKCPEFFDIYFAVDSEEAAKEIEKFGGRYVMTSVSCPTGTHRLIEFVEKTQIKADVFVNWQADEPLISSEMIKDLLEGIDLKSESIWTLKKEAKKEEVVNPNVVKVVTDRFGKALYFSRSQIPFDRDGVGGAIYKHIGLYAYSLDALLKIKALPPSPLSELEKLEQLAFLENGLSIHVHETLHESIGVDTVNDLHRVNSFFQKTL
ncbi:MAG: 3-deoxy-manno-octulosonate cytidylyltransferase [Chlamydiae bacterium]|nr:3-deoxy-manno-octulosonate cytidylyltransferase [Chlamydiota bacterium]